MLDVTRERPELCSGTLHIFIEDESSYRCEVCNWIGWPRQTVEPGTGRVLAVEPHPRAKLPFIATQ